MIKDCIEDRHYLRKHPIAIRTWPTQNPRISNLGHGIPTVEEVWEIADLYYGPPKLVVPSWICLN